MGKSRLDRGLLPGTGSDDVPSPDLQFALLWATLSYHTHRFSGRPIAEMLVSWTTIMLMDRGHAPTIGDIAKATGLPRPTISRYVNHQIEQGWAEERVSPVNRRRRELFLTESGERELEGMLDFFHEMFQAIQSYESGVSGQESGKRSGDDLLSGMRAMSAYIAQNSG